MGAWEKINTNSIWWGVLILCIGFVSWVVAGSMEQARIDARQDTKIESIEHGIDGINSKFDKIDEKLDKLLEKTTRNERSD